MTIEDDTLREELRALLESPQLGLPAYSADPIVQRRVGNGIAQASKDVLARL
jgi:hypothetical protein